MRRPVDAERIRRFMRELGGEAERDLRLYFTGGATAVLIGWRSSTLDVDIKVEPESDRVSRAIPRVKEKLEINIELAAPDQFIPEVPGWEERSAFIAREGRLSFYHYDFYAQALSKIQRGHAQDRGDVRQMLERGLIDPQELRHRFEQIEPRLYKFPAINPTAFRSALAEALQAEESSFPPA
ncbi:MAG: DUF6036 family nucleotidyltransferase [Thermoanaerobaculia bacterium]